MFYAIHWHKMAKNLVAREIGQLLWTDGLVTYMIRKLRSCSPYLSYFFSYKIMVAKQKFEKCTVATLGVPCIQHGTPNTAWQNQPQSAINLYNARFSMHCRNDSIANHVIICVLN